MRFWKKEHGLSMIWMALTLVVLLGMAGFGLDLGWIYLSTTRAQKAVDSAALAGVVNLPGFIAQAIQDAEDATAANGYDPDGLSVTPLADNKLHAELRIEIEPIFLGVLGFDHFNITRESTAEYVKPVPLGNPDNCFGCPGFGSSWAAISSRFIHKEHGDPYSTECLVPSSPSACSSGNGDFARGGAYDGYYYGIEVPTGSSGLQVEIYDAGFHARPQDEGTGDFTIGGGGGGPTTTYGLHAVDNTPLDPTNNPAITGCSSTYGPGTGPQDSWETLCTLSGAVTPGIYVLHVTTSGTGIASNHYSVRATTSSSPQPKVFGINDMSIWSNDLVEDSQLYLAEIAAIHAGKKLELQFYDPGDADADSFMRLLSPNGPVNCSWTVWNHNLTVDFPAKAGSDLPCAWQTTDVSDPDGDGDRRNFNEKWIVATIDLPDDPDAMCNPALPADRRCFWRMELDLSLPTERTTWRARVIGNPVRLVPLDPVP